jgi:hypothetical protein
MARGFRRQLTLQRCSELVAPPLFTAFRQSSSVLIRSHTPEPNQIYPEAVMAANKVTAVHATLWIFPSCTFEPPRALGGSFFVGVRLSLRIC